MQLRKDLALKARMLGVTQREKEVKEMQLEQERRQFGADLAGGQRPQGPRHVSQLRLATRGIVAENFARMASMGPVMPTLGTLALGFPDDIGLGPSDDGDQIMQLLFTGMAVQQNLERVRGIREVLERANAHLDE